MVRDNHELFPLNNNVGFFLFIFKYLRLLKMSV